MGGGRGGPGPDPVCEEAFGGPSTHGLLQGAAPAFQESERRGRSPGPVGCTAAGPTAFSRSRLWHRRPPAGGRGRGGAALREPEPQVDEPQRGNWAWAGRRGRTRCPAELEVCKESLDGAYYSEPERDVPWSASSSDLPMGLSHRKTCLPDVGRAQVLQPQVPPLRGRAAISTARGAAAERTSSSSSMSVPLKSRAASDPWLLPSGEEGGAAHASVAQRAAHASSHGARSSTREEGTDQTGAAAGAVQHGRCRFRCCRSRGTPERPSLSLGRQGSPGADLQFLSWLSDEVQSCPDETQLKSVPKSHLVEVAKVPHRLEKLLAVGFLLCLDILLHELSYTPLQVARALPKLLARGLSATGIVGAASRRRSAGKPVLSVTEQGDLIRLTLLLLNVALVLVCFDVSWTYHYIRGESFLKLYVIFNMLEMFERWWRSVGVDLFDLVAASVRDPWYSLLPKYLATLLYCFSHSTMHLVRVLLLNVAINTSSNAVFLIIVTNNFGEIKSTVFKRYEAKSLFPIITSDIVERFYLLTDILFVLARLSISTHSGIHRRADVMFWLFLLVGLEIGTDWIKFCLVTKFSDLSTTTLEVYKEVLLADVLLCRSPWVDAGSKGNDATNAPAKDKMGVSPPTPAVPFRGIHSFSHSLQRRLGFSGVPMTTIFVFHFVMLARAPCIVELQWPRTTFSVFVAASFVLALLMKILLGVTVVGFAAAAAAGSHGALNSSQRSNPCRPAPDLHDGQREGPATR
eukprot:CAMPEP_0168493726 /NCGR_PEP_ID=MMETSP0228-20121227/70866_1 /TAXON_ID=133427 /ORGANISM="Protoceratium reticulatum, Strain CCCM 535 (=CCMP 1889)" /LENGTH=744 /DNA_ID=CAMNT_0008510515 /DNA_START=39 /DNA_END=2275 /DNA_ORIENTATION=+